MIIVIHSVSLLFSLAAIYIMDKKAGLTNLIPVIIPRCSYNQPSIQGLNE